MRSGFNFAWVMGRALHLYFPTYDLWPNTFVSSTLTINISSPHSHRNSIAQYDNVNTGAAAIIYLLSACDSPPPSHHFAGDLGVFKLHTPRYSRTATPQTLGIRILSHAHQQLLMTASISKMPTTTRAITRAQTKAKAKAKRSDLLALPAELRNTIYELAFTTDYDDGETIDLLTAKFPNEGLLICHQIYNEACQIYKAKRRTFWATSSLVLDLQRTLISKSIFALLNTSDVEHIISLQAKNATSS